MGREPQASGVEKAHGARAAGERGRKAHGARAAGERGRKSPWGASRRRAGSKKPMGREPQASGVENARGQGTAGNWEPCPARATRPWVPCGTAPDRGLGGFCRIDGRTDPGTPPKWDGARSDEQAHRFTAAATSTHASSVRRVVTMSHRADRGKHLSAGRRTFARALRLRRIGHRGAGRATAGSVTGRITREPLLCAADARSVTERPRPQRPVRHRRRVARRMPVVTRSSGRAHTESRSARSAAA